MIVHCDFCGNTFRTFKWNNRTCEGCKRRGAPSQSELEWIRYEKAAREYAKQRRRKK